MCSAKTVLQQTLNFCSIRKCEIVAGLDLDCTIVTELSTQVLTGWLAGYLPTYLLQIPAVSWSVGRCKVVFGMVREDGRW